MKIKLLLTICILTQTRSEAQITVNNDVKSLINRAFTYFPKIREAEQAVKISEERLALTTLNKMPDIGFTTSYNYIMPKISFPINGREIQFAPVNNIAASVGTSYTLMDFGRLKSGISKAKADIEVSKDNVKVARNQLAMQVATVYYNIIYFRKAMLIQDSIISYFRQNKQLAENKLKNGDMLQTDILNLQSNIDAEENKKIEFINNLNKQTSLLDYATGNQTVSTDNFDFNLETSGAGIGIAEAGNPEFKLAKDRVMAAAKDVDLARLNSKPRLALNAATGLRNGYVPDVNDVRFNYLAGITFSLPIYGFGKTTQQVRLQEAIVKQAQLAQETLANNFKKDIELTLSDISSYEQRITNTESQLLAAKQAEEITASRYRNGVATYLDVTAAATNLERAAFSKLQLEYQLCMSKIQLSGLLGMEYWNQ